MGGIGRADVVGVVAPPVVVIGCPLPEAHTEQDCQDEEHGGEQVGCAVSRG